MFFINGFYILFLEKYVKAKHAHICVYFIMISVATFIINRYDYT